MALLERVATLVRANLNDLIDQAEDPEKMIKQVVLDMQNQLLQVKTQVAIAIADQHLLEKKRLENDEKVKEWMRKAELAVDKKQDDLARASLLRVESYRELSAGFAQQVEDQRAQVENLKSALRKLEQKMAEANAKADMLITQHRPGTVSDGKRAPLETRVLFRGIHGRLELDLSGKDKSRSGSVVPTFYSLAGEVVTIPKRFQEVARAITAAVQCTGCSHCHFVRAPKEEAETGAAVGVPANRTSEQDLSAVDVT